MTYPRGLRQLFLEQLSLVFRRLAALVGNDPLGGRKAGLLARTAPCFLADVEPLARFRFCQAKCEVNPLKRSRATVSRRRWLRSLGKSLTTILLSSRHRSTVHPQQFGRDSHRQVCHVQVHMDLPGRFPALMFLRNRAGRRTHAFEAFPSGGKRSHLSERTPTHGGYVPTLRCQRRRTQNQRDRGKNSDRSLGRPASQGERRSFKSLGRTYNQ